MRPSAAWEHPPIRLYRVGDAYFVAMAIIGSAWPADMGWSSLTPGDGLLSRVRLDGIERQASAGGGGTPRIPEAHAAGRILGTDISLTPWRLMPWATPAGTSTSWGRSAMGR